MNDNILRFLAVVH